MKPTLSTIAVALVISQTALAKPVTTPPPIWESSSASTYPSSTSWIPSSSKSRTTRPPRPTWTYTPSTTYYDPGVTSCTFPEPCTSTSPVLSHSSARPPKSSKPPKSRTIGTSTTSWWPPNGTVTRTVTRTKTRVVTVTAPCLTYTPSPTVIYD
ncbi:hypothetical protein BG003_003755 [Podila horticola]|nr:hypothetical protein BG003_003755 [Podila horticola]